MSPRVLVIAPTQSQAKIWAGWGGLQDKSWKWVERADQLRGYNPATTIVAWVGNNSIRPDYQELVALVDLMSKMAGRRR